MSSDDVDLAIKINWRDHPARLAANLRSMLDGGEMCDVVFVWREETVRAHRVVLAASSTLLRSRLAPGGAPAIWDLSSAESAWLGGRVQGAVLLKHLRYIIRLVYCGWLELRESEISSLLHSAKHLLFDEVSELLERVTAARSTSLSDTQVSTPALSLPSYVLIHSLADGTAGSLEPSSALTGAPLDPSSSLTGASLDPSSGLTGASLDPSSALSDSSLDPSSALTAASLEPTCSLAVCSDIVDASLAPGPGLHSVEADAGQMVSEGTLRVRPSCELQRDSSTTMLSDPLLCAGAQLELHTPLPFQQGVGSSDSGLLQTPSLSQLKLSADMFPDGSQPLCPSSPTDPSGLEGEGARPHNECFPEPPLLRVRAACELQHESHSHCGLAESNVLNEDVSLLSDSDTPMTAFPGTTSSLMQPPLDNSAPLLRVRPQFELHCPWGGETDYYGTLDSSEFDGHHWASQVPALLGSSVRETDSAAEYQLYLARAAGTEIGDSASFVDINLSMNPIAHDTTSGTLDADLVQGDACTAVPSVSDLSGCQSSVADGNVRVRALPSLSADVSKPLPSRERLVRANPRRAVLISADQSSVCQLCGATFARMSHLQRHVRLVHVSADADAPSSSTVDVSAVTAADDVTETTEESGRDRTAVDCKSSHAPLSYKCSECDFSAKTERELKLHALDVHSSVRFKCHLCEMSFAKQQGLYQHVRCTHPGSRTFLKQCPLCGFSSGRSSLVRRHMAQAHSVDERGHALPCHYRCKDCDFATDSFRKLKAHVLNRHVSDKQFKCSQCEYSSEAKQSLERHVRIMHSEERPYHCEICGFRAATLSRISRHRRSHTKERPHQCSVCGARYAEARRLREHVQKHGDGAAAARFVCSTCGVTFSRRDNMQAHVAAKHPTTAS